MRFLQTWNAWKFAMFKNFINSQLLKPIFLSPNHCETQIQKIIKLQNTLFYRSATSPFVVQLFLLPLVLIPQSKTSVSTTPVTSSNLRNQDPLFTELRLLQATHICTAGTALHRKLWRLSCSFISLSRSKRNMQLS